MKFFLHNFPTHFSLLTSFITSNLSFIIKRMNALSMPEKSAKTAIVTRDT